MKDLFSKGPTLSSLYIPLIIEFNTVARYVIREQEIVHFGAAQPWLNEVSTPIPLGGVTTS